MDEDSASSPCNYYEAVSYSKFEIGLVSAGHAIDRLAENVTESAFNNAFRELRIKLDDDRSNQHISKSSVVVAIKVNTNNVMEEVQLPSENEKIKNKNTDLTLKLTKVAEYIKENETTVNITSVETEINTLAQTIIETSMNNALQQIISELRERGDDSVVQDKKQKNETFHSRLEERYIDNLVQDVVEYSIANAVKELKKEQVEFSDIDYLEHISTSAYLPSITKSCNRGRFGAHSGIVVDNRNLRSELVDLEHDIFDGDFGLVELFKENINPGSRKKGPKTTVKSKRARKRKKQLQKLTKHVQESSRFATTFTELQVEKDVEPNLACAVCLEMFYLPHKCQPCGHIFCDPCLRRLTGQGSAGVRCPLCRAVIMSCVLDFDFNHFIRQSHPDVHTARSVLERRLKYRNYALPYTPPTPLGRRLLRPKLITNRNNQTNTRWFKFLLGCTVGICVSLLIMVFNKVRSILDARDVNIMFLSGLVGALMTYVIFKVCRL